LIQYFCLESFLEKLILPLYLYCSIWDEFLCKKLSIFEEFIQNQEWIKDARIEALNRVSDK
jgi:hypothetical protein